MIFNQIIICTKHTRSVSVCVCVPMKQHRFHVLPFKEKTVFALKKQHCLLPLKKLHSLQNIEIIFSFKIHINV